jgi:hypothetical protein
MAKLYHKVSRFLVRRQISRHDEKRLKWAMTLKPGDIVNHCTGFNVKIIDAVAVIKSTSRGWYVTGFEFKVSPFGGFCSLMHCGVGPAIPRDKVESDWLKHTEFRINSGAMRKWFGKDQESFDKEMSLLQKRIDALKSSNHITNELGMIIKEYSNYQDFFIE